MTRTAWLGAALLASGCALHQPAAEPASLEQQVLAAERAFAASMATRDLAAFESFLADEAVFFNGEQALRGRAAVLAHWAHYFEDKQAPFSWAPDQVVVLASGDLALSTGPVRDPQGRTVARFNSIWRRETDGRWRVVFDKGSPLAQ